jgi:hypothetical protein
MEGIEGKSSISGHQLENEVGTSKGELEVLSSPFSLQSKNN